jgi:hypothetical protein
MPRAASGKPAKAAKASKAMKAVKSAKPAKATKVVTKKAAKPKKNSFQPLEGISHVLVDFKDTILEGKIKLWGGTVTRSVKTADSLVCEDFYSDKAMDACNKYGKHDYVVSKEVLEDQLAEYKMTSEKTYPQLSIGKKSIDMRVEWFTHLGEPVALSRGGLSPAPEAGVSVVSDGGEGYYDCCYHEGGDVKDMYSRLYRLQLLQNPSTQEYIISTSMAWMNDIACGNESKTTSTTWKLTKEEAISGFESDFRDAMGFTWKNRKTCKPKKGLGLMADLSGFRK